MTMTFNPLDLLQQSEVEKHLLAKLLINDIKHYGHLSNIQEAEFRVYSQFGDDGIIQYLLSFAEIRKTEHRFVEFGVENYKEANTRFLLVNDNWSGLVLDGDKKNIQLIQKDELYWKHDLTAQAVFITKNNITTIIKENRFDKDLGLLSIDLDGNDYWIWCALNHLMPVILVIEYNALFGKDLPITIPYSPQFNRTAAHNSNLYWGSSLKAIYDYSKSKGYAFVGTNSAGNNAYFVRRDRLGGLNSVSLKRGFTESKYRESRNKFGKLTYLSKSQGLSLIGDMSVYNVKTNRNVKIGKILLS